MPKVVDREQMQHDILDAAMNVYAVKGYHAATIADVAEAAGLGKGTLYLYFKNKDAIVTSIVERHFNRLEEQITQTDAPETLDALLAALAETMTPSEDQSRFVRVFFEVFGPSFASDAFSAQVAGFFDRLGTHYAARIAHLQTKGEIRADAEAHALGRALASLLDGMLLHRGLFQLSQARYAVMRQQTIALFARGLRP